MNRLLITGANGFVGRWLVRAAVEGGYAVIAALQPGTPVPDEWRHAEFATAIDAVPADLLEPADIRRLGASRPDAVVHLAAVASGAAARRDPGLAERVNRDATAALARDLAVEANPLFLFVSTGEVYGGGHAGPIDETAAPAPVSPYAASKLSAEMALGELAVTNGLRWVVARPFPHTGPGQTTDYVLPAFAARLLDAQRHGATAVRTGNLDIVRDFLDVRDVVQAYLRLLEHGEVGEVFNVASGVGRSLRDCFDELRRLVGVDAIAVADAALLRPGDIPALVGDARKLTRHTGWMPHYSFDRTLQDLVDAQAH